MTDRNSSRQAEGHGYPVSILPGSQPLFPGPGTIGLAGTGLVADDLYLLAHHDVTGRPLLRRRPLGIGLAGALLAELLLGASISVPADGCVTASRSSPADDLARRVRDQIAAEPALVLVREWLLFFARGAATDVAQRLERAGYLGHARSLLPGRPGRWVPVDSTLAFAPIIRVRSALDPVRRLDPRHAALAGLAEACGLGFRIAQARAPGGCTVQEAAEQLDPQLRYLITQTQVAADSVVLSGRS